MKYSSDYQASIDLRICGDVYLHKYQRWKGPVSFPYGTSRDSQFRVTMKSACSELIYQWQDREVTLP